MKTVTIIDVVSLLLLGDRYRRELQLPLFISTQYDQIGYITSIRVETNNEEEWFIDCYDGLGVYSEVYSKLKEELDGTES